MSCRVVQIVMNADKTLHPGKHESFVTYRHEDVALYVENTCDESLKKHVIFGKNNKMESKYLTICIRSFLVIMGSAKITVIVLY